MEQPLPGPQIDLQAALAQIAALEARLTAMQSTPLPPAEPAQIQHRSFKDTILALFTSRKFLLLLLDTIISLLLMYHAVDAEFIAVIQPVFVMLIYAIAKEDAAEKSAPRSVQVQEIHAPAGVETEVSNP